VQDPASCVVASMPVRALERAGADYVATPERIGHLIAERRSA
jgi:chemotaxis response regulator CheB